MRNLDFVHLYIMIYFRQKKFSTSKQLPYRQSTGNITQTKEPSVSTLNLENWIGFSANGRRFQFLQTKRISNVSHLNLTRNSRRAYCVVKGIIITFLLSVCVDGYSSSRVIEGAFQPSHDGIGSSRKCAFRVLINTKPFVHIYCPVVNLTSPGSYLKVSLKINIRIKSLS